MPYKDNIRYSSKFDKSIKKIKKQAPSRVKRIEQVVNFLIKNPETFDKPLTGKRNYKLEKYVGKKDYRILYRYCNYCIKHKQKDVETCRDCKEVLKSGGGIMFLDIFKKNTANTKKKGRKKY